MATYMGAPKQNTIRPKFQVRKLEGERTVRKIKYVTAKNKKGNPVPKREEFDAKVEAGYLVAFPAGHVIRLGSLEELQRLSFDQDADLVDMESGEVIEQQAPVDLFTNAARQAGMEDVV